MIFALEMGAWGVVDWGEDAGMRKGSAPEGEAWFEDGIKTTSMLAMRRIVCTLRVSLSI